MGYYSGLEKDYTPEMNAGRFASAGPSPVGGGFSEPKSMFSEQRGTFSTPRGMFMPDGSEQQDRAISRGARRGMPTALNPDTPPIKSTLAPSTIGQPARTRSGRIFGADLSLSPFMEDPVFSVEQLSGRMGML